MSIPKEFLKLAKKVSSDLKTGVYKSKKWHTEILVIDDYLQTGNKTNPIRVGNISKRIEISKKVVDNLYNGDKDFVYFLIIWCFFKEMAVPYDTPPDYIVDKWTLDFIRNGNKKYNVKNTARNMLKAILPSMAESNKGRIDHLHKSVLHV